MSPAKSLAIFLAMSDPCANSTCGKHPTWRRKHARAIAFNADPTRFLEQTEKTFREIPANIFVRQTVTKRVNLRGLFFYPTRVEISGGHAWIDRSGLIFSPSNAVRA
jgi:hypothetical protein